MSGSTNMQPEPFEFHLTIVNNAVHFGSTCLLSISAEPLTSRDALINSGNVQAACRWLRCAKKNLLLAERSLGVEQRKRKGRS